MCCEYVATVVPSGYERHLIRLGAAPLCVIDVPRGQGPFVTWLARRWLLGDVLPDSVRVWPVPTRKGGR